jgi:hypothetical protein
MLKALSTCPSYKDYHESGDVRMVRNNGLRQGPRNFDFVN